MSDHPPKYLLYNYKVEWINEISYRKMLFIRYKLKNGRLDIYICLFKEHEDLNLPDQVDVLILDTRYKDFLPSTRIHDSNCNSYYNDDICCGGCGSSCTCKFEYENIQILTINQDLLSLLKTTVQYAENYEKDRLVRVEFTRHSQEKEEQREARRMKNIQRAEERKKENEKRWQFMKYITLASACVVIARGCYYLSN